MGFASAVGALHPDTFGLLAGEHGNHLVKELNKGLVGIEAFPLDFALVDQLFGDDGVVFLVDVEVLAISLSGHGAAPPCA